MGVTILDAPVDEGIVEGAAPRTGPSLPIPTAGSRLVGVVLEVSLFIVVAVGVYLVEYFLSGPVADFGPSNFWIAAFIMAAWNGAQFVTAQSAHGAMVGHFFADDHGRPASLLTIVARQLTRFAMIYGVPLLAFDQHVWLAIAVAAVSGLAIATDSHRRAPWDHLAGTTVIGGFPTDAKLALAPVNTAADLQLEGKRKRDESRARGLLLGAGLFSVLASGLIVWAIFSEAAEFVFDDEFSWGILSADGWFPRRGRFDLSTLFVGTLWITGIAMLVAGPVGLGVAIYLSEYASPRVRRFLKPTIETLASIPSVVIGLFAISFISPKILQPIFGSDEIGIFSLLAAGIGVGVLTVPIVASISEDAMRAVPQELREASYGLGARRVTTALRVVFPAALSGISAAFIVGISRAIGETMVVFIAAGGSGGSIFETDPTKPGQAITAAMASLGAGTDSVAGSGLAFQSLYFLGALLFILTLLLNVISDRIVRRFRQVY